MGGDFYMKFRRSWKCVLAAVLSAVLTLGAVGGLAPVKTWADALSVNLSPGGSITIMVTGNITQANHALSDSTVNLGDFDAGVTPIIIAIGNDEPVGSYVVNLRNLLDDVTVHVLTITVSAPGGGNDDSQKPGDNPNNGEDPALRTLPPTGPDGHQHDWHWEYGSTYHCSICNTFYTVYPAHDHQYEWYVTKPATETDDGEAHHMCKICGSVDLIEPVGAFYLFSQNAENKINKAPIGGTVNVETTRWLSFQGYVLDALAKRPDVTLNVTFRENGYKGGAVKTVTIPAGYDAASLKDANGYCGFKYLAGVFGAN